MAEDKKTYNPSDDDITYFGKTNFRHREQVFGIRRDDRRRHMYVLGKTGVGKSTLLENLALSDIQNGEGIAFFDPHGESVEKLLNYIPSERINDVVYINPHDTEYPIGFNVLELKDPSQKHLVASGLMAVFTKLWANVWSARMEYILNNTVLALLDTPGQTLLGIPRMYADKKYRAKVVQNIKDPVVKNFWEGEYANWQPGFASEAVSPIQNKVGQFLSSSIMRNIVSQPKSTIEFREIMDDRKILLVNLSKGKIGEDSSALLGAMMITKLQLAAMSRVDMKEAERNDFYLYVDEFQNFATESFATILSEARKYKLNLIIAHQYIQQLYDAKNRASPVRDAIFGNVGTMVVFRTGADDAEFLEKEFEPVFELNDLVNLSKYHVYLKLMINGVSSTPFSAATLPPIGEPTDSEEKVIRVSRERYATTKENIERKIYKWLDLEYFEDVAKTESPDESPDEGAEESRVEVKTTDSDTSKPKPQGEKPREKEQFRHKTAPRPQQAKPQPKQGKQEERKQETQQSKHEEKKEKPGDEIWEEITQIQEQKQAQTADDIMDNLLEALESSRLKATDVKSAPSKSAPVNEARSPETKDEKPSVSTPEKQPQDPASGNKPKPEEQDQKKENVSAPTKLKPGERVQFS